MGERFDGYTQWVDRRRVAIVIGAAILTVLGTILAIRLPLHADLANLLPPQERSVRDLDSLGRRTVVFGVVLCVITSDDPALRAQGAQAFARRIRQLDRTLVANVVSDDGAARRFVWDHRFLFAPLGDLQSARDTLAARVRRATLNANPLYISLDEEDDDGAGGPNDALEELRRKLADAENKATHPDEFVSKDGRVQLLIVEAPFPSSSVDQGERLLAALGAAMAEAAREVGPGAHFGITEDVVIAVAEHRAVLEGMTLAVILTVLVVGLSLFLYYRSLPALLALFGSLAVGTMATFGITRLTIGHLNSFTAFLSSIVVGNGINFGLLVLARHLEERRAGQPPLTALARALGGSFTGTLTAALAAGVAYASLVVTDFRGFRDFGYIGGIGMVLCWLSAYIVLPALLAILERRGLVRARREPGLGPLLARLLPRRPAPVLAAGGLIVAASLVVTIGYLRGDPFEYDWQHMRADRGLARNARHWMDTIDQAFGRQLVGGFVVGVGSADAAVATERALRARAEDEPGSRPEAALFRKVSSIYDFVPTDQPAKLALLAELRKLLDDKTIDALEPATADTARKFRPPPDLRALTLSDVPDLLARRYLERDGTRGRLLFANQASRFDGWNGRDMIAFADAVRSLDLPPDTALGGGAFVFVDVLRAVAQAGPRATLAALIGVAAFVVVVVGLGRYAAITLGCLVGGTAMMIASAALLGIKVNFLDFVALPITLGIGVDYAVNVVSRVRADARASGMEDPRHALATTGGAVVLCSWTTTVGYGSLLLSANAGIRSFGLTAILGEVTCLLVALTLAPALLAVTGRRRESAER